MSWSARLFNVDSRAWLILPGNAFWSNKNLVDIAPKILVGRVKEEFEDACRDVAQKNGHTLTDIYRDIEDGNPAFQQALLYALLYATYKQKCAGKTFDIAAGYSFGFFASVLMLLGVTLKEGTKAAYMRGNAQRIACEYFGIHPPFQHLFSVPHGGNPEKLLDYMNEVGLNRPQPAIINQSRITFASPTYVDDPSNLPKDSEVYNHMPYHYSDIMKAAGSLFLEFCQQQLKGGDTGSVTFISGAGEGQVTFVCGNLKTACQWIAKEIATPIDFRQVVATIRAGDNVHTLAPPVERGRTMLKIACGSKTAPGIWHTHVAE